MMSTENTGRLLRLQGSPIDDLVRFEDRGTEDGERRLIPQLAKTDGDAVRWGRLAGNAAVYETSEADGLAWPVWRFPAHRFHITRRTSRAATAIGQDPGRDFGDLAASRRARDHAAIWLEHTNAAGEIRRWSSHDRAEFLNVAGWRNAIRYTEVRRTDTKRLLAPLGSGRRDLFVVIDTRRLWETGWLVELG